MSRTLIKVGAVIDASNQINSAKSSVSSAKSSFTQTKNSIDGKIQNRSNIRNRLSTVQSQLSRIDSQVGRIRSTVQFGANQYKNTDDAVNREGKEIKGNIGAQHGYAQSIFSRYFDDDFREKVKKTKDDLRKTFGDPEQYPDYVLERVWEFSEDATKFSCALKVLQMGKEAFSLFGVESENVLDIFATDTFKTYVLKTESEKGWESFYNTEESLGIALESNADLTKLENIGKNKNKIKDKIDKAEKYLEDHGLRWKDAETEYYKDGKKIDKKDAPAFYERQATVAEVKVEKKASVSAYKSEGEFLGGTGSVTVAEAEAHANFRGGFYVIGADGEEVFSPGVSAEIGVSATAFQADYENQLLGNEMFGLNVDAEVTALSASATAGVDVNVFGKDKDGKVVFDPQVNVGAKAEAVLVEAEGSIGVNVLGGEASLKGSVKVGVGAHADIGIKDGVVKCEIGASLGLGFDVGFEVDVGGMVNTAVDAAKSAWEGITSWWK